MSVLRPLAGAFAFLTRVPIGTGKICGRDLGRSVAFFPIAGLALGVPLAAFVMVAHGRLSCSVIGAALAALLAALTGGLHLDGLADVFDGLGGGHGDRERMLAIMRDSRIGAHGAVAVMLVLLAKVFALTDVVQQRDLWLLLAFPATGRWAVVPLVVFFPYGREEGLGKEFHAQGTAKEVAWATVVVAAMGVGMGARLIGAGALALAVAVAFGVWMQRRLGGLTGDVYGAAIELAEVVFLVAACRGA